MQWLYIVAPRATDEGRLSKFEQYDVISSWMVLPKTFDLFGSKESSMLGIFWAAKKSW